jgi:hypothetical protein
MNGSDCYRHRRVALAVTGFMIRPTFGVWPSSAARGNLAFVRRARELGFTLDQVRALLTLSAKDGRDTCAEVHHLAAEHLTEVRAKIADLRAMERILARRRACCAAGELPRCPIITPSQGV